MRALLLALLWVAALPAWAETIGLSIPQTGRYAPLGSQIEFGFLQAIEDHVRTGGKRPQTAIIDDRCSEDGAKAGLATLRERQARIVVGAPCFDAAFALAEGLGDVPVLAMELRHPETNERIAGGAPLFVVGPDGAAEAEAIADLVLQRWRDRPFALLDDGSVYGRALSDRLRELADARGLKPIEVATFRPLQSNQRALLRRLGRSGVEALFVAGDAEDAATFARDAAAVLPGAEVATGEPGLLLPFVDEPPPAGAFVVGQPERRDHPSASILVERFGDRGVPPDDGILEGYALAQIALDTLGGVALANTTHDTVIGPVRFRDGRAVPQPFRLLRWNGTALVAIE